MIFGSGASESAVILLSRHASGRGKGLVDRADLDWPWTGLRWVPSGAPLIGRFEPVLQAKPESLAGCSGATRDPRRVRGAVVLRIPTLGV